MVEHLESNEPWKLLRLIILKDETSLVDKFGEILCGCLPANTPMGPNQSLAQVFFGLWLNQGFSRPLELVVGP